MMPVVVILIAIAVGAYFLLSRTKTEAAAKELFIKGTFWINLVVGGLFLLFTLYALIDKNMWMTELFGSVVVVNAVFILIATIAKRIFLKNRPHYQWKKIKLKQ